MVKELIWKEQSLQQMVSRKVDSNIHNKNEVKDTETREVAKGVGRVK